MLTSVAAEVTEHINIHSKISQWRIFCDLSSSLDKRDVAIVF